MLTRALQDARLQDWKPGENVHTKIKTAHIKPLLQVPKEALEYNMKRPPDIV